MSSERYLAGVLLQNAETSSFLNKEGVEVAPGVNLSPPYEELYAMRALYDPIPYGVPSITADSYYDNIDFLQNSMPKIWLPTLATIAKNRKKNGISEPLNFWFALSFTRMEMAERFKEIETETGKQIGDFPVIESFPDFSDRDITTRIMNTILSDTRLSTHFIESASISIPDMPNNWVDYDDFYNLTRALGVEDEPILDLACGTGGITCEMTENGLTMIGVERQYHPDFYSDNWSANDNHDDTSLRFVRADTRYLPFPDNHFNVAIMTCAETYMTRPALTKTLESAKRVLKTDGVFVIGPQYTKDESRFAVLVKTETEKGTKFVKHKMSEFIG